VKLQAALRLSASIFASIEKRTDGSDEVIMSIAGHVSRAMLSRYSHVRMEAKRRALDEIAKRQCAADEKRKEEAERRGQVAVVAQSAVVQ
jgi:regulator of PEP synthase PpsR (kinase-PPPase family)